MPKTQKTQRSKTSKQVETPIQPQTETHEQQLVETPGIQIICSQNDLSTNLSLVSHAVPQRPTHPILANVLLFADEKSQQVHLTVFDLSLGIQTSFDAQVRSGGEITIPVEILSDIVERFPQGDITFNNQAVKADKLGESEETAESLIATLTADSGRYQVRGLSAEEFPRLPEVTVQQAIHLPAETLKVGLRGSLFATTSDEAKLILTGVHIKLEQDILELAATDGHRLAVLQASTQGIAGKKKQPDNTDDAPLSLSFTVPAKALRELERILEMRTSTDPVALYYKKEEEIVAFHWGKQRLVSRCLEGQYPAYPELLKHDFKHQMTLEKAPLVKALERIAVLADKKEKTVKLYFNSEDQQLSLFMARDFGEGEELIPACISGESLYICFNIKYLLDAVKAIRSSEVQMQLTSSDGPAIVVPFGNRDKPHVLIDVKYLLMPVVKGV
ncbi:MAG: DNA polymerase III subunit beta [Stigonema ocellatum SAG 48.90 = DSM 106950]|nr:DNA polymerase III subunit beta [Stigonema ocellatum SAG 48.90 = DSM 106950]